LGDREAGDRETRSPDFPDLTDDGCDERTEVGLVSGVPAMFWARGEVLAMSGSGAVAGVGARGSRAQGSRSLGRRCKRVGGAVTALMQAPAIVAATACLHSAPRTSKRDKIAKVAEAGAVGVVAGCSCSARRAREVGKFCGRENLDGRAWVSGGEGRATERPDRLWVEWSAGLLKRELRPESDEGSVDVWVVTGWRWWMLTLAC